MTFYWSIVLLDLGVVVPATLAAAIAVWRGASAGSQGFYAVLGGASLLFSGYAAERYSRDMPRARG